MIVGIVVGRNGNSDVIEVGKIFFHLQRLLPGSFAKLLEAFLRLIGFEDQTNLEITNQNENNYHNYIISS